MKTLEEIKKIDIHENNEPLVEIPENDKIKLLREHKFLSPYLRKSACELLLKATDSLPFGYKILVVTAYRSVSMQKKLWRQRLWQMAKRHPLKMIFQYRKWRRLTTKYTSPPGGSSHQCGGAVDVTIIKNDGNRFDMGTTLTDFGEKVHTNCDLITEEQKKNRQILYGAMTNAGFANYPLEWWHYSYGDRMWAAYTERIECFYGPIKE